MKQFKFLQKTFLLPLLAATFLTSCSPDEPEAILEQELITTVELTFRSSSEVDQIVRWSTTSANSESITLKANSEYQVEIAFYDESDPADIEDITEEVIEEADEHQVFYEFSGITIPFVQGGSDALDEDQNPVFIHTVWSTGEIGNGVVSVYLIHEPTTKTSTSRDGFGGETDVAVDIPLVVIE
jgi:hypothetical protein